jgi:hypothetical protein
MIKRPAEIRERVSLSTRNIKNSELFPNSESQSFQIDIISQWEFLSFNAIHSVIKKMFHKGPVATNGACQKWHILFLDIFQQKRPRNKR